MCVLIPSSATPKELRIQPAVEVFVLVGFSYPRGGGVAEMDCHLVTGL